ncbi:hypothetical protein DITRI_Ditri20bG0062200 [Diplodiscus trichospermus]
MDTTEISKNNIVSTVLLDEKETWDDLEFQELVQSLPKERDWWGTHGMYLYQGVWCPSPALKAVVSFQKHFQALDSDIILIPFPKCGTTWLKALTFSTVNRHQFAKEENSVLSFGPHQIVRFFEYDIYLNNPSPDLDNCSLYRPRLFSTHIPFASLPTSIKDCNSKIVYICRNPMDMFISLWFFTDKLRAEDDEPLSLDEAFQLFCRGIYNGGPFFFYHILGYWKASQENPNKILFLQYEDLKEDIISNIKKLAMFLGCPFTEEEEKRGVVEEIARTCSLGNMKELDVNKYGRHSYGIKHNTYLGKQRWEIGAIL